MSLTQDQIKFIDTYLKNSDIGFIDVRMEMVDHVASAVEKRMEEHGQSFYDAFKDFMVAHKRHLTKDYERLRKKLQLRSFWSLWPTLKKPWMVLLFLCVFFFLENYEGIFAKTFPYVPFVWISLTLVALVYFISTFPKRKYRFSSLEALVWPLLVSMYMLHIAFNFGRGNPLFYEVVPYLINGFTAFYTCFLTTFLIVFFKVRHSYKLKFA